MPTGTNSDVMCPLGLFLFPFTPLIELFGIYKMFKMLNHPDVHDVGTSYLSVFTKVVETLQDTRSDKSQNFCLTELNSV